MKSFRLASALVAMLALSGIAPSARAQTPTSPPQGSTTLPAVTVTAAPTRSERYAQAFNFGPLPGANRRVREVVEEILKHWPGRWEQVVQEKHLKEAPLLSLAIDKAKAVLDWTPCWDFARTVAETVAWYREHDSGSPGLREFTQKQIASYASASAQSR